jgi:hypothetical protein
MKKKAGSGYCLGHDYADQDWRKKGSSLEEAMKDPPSDPAPAVEKVRKALLVCTVEGCTARLAARGFCARHYKEFIIAKGLQSHYKRLGSRDAPPKLPARVPAADSKVSDEKRESSATTSAPISKPVVKPPETASSRTGCANRESVSARVVIVKVAHEKLLELAGVAGDWNLARASALNGKLAFELHSNDDR